MNSVRDFFVESFRLNSAGKIFVSDGKNLLVLNEEHEKKGNAEILDC